MAGLASLSLLGAFTPVVLSAAPATAAATDLIISEYIEGSSNNKALEIYNGTGAAIDLTAGDYAVQMYFNGSSAVGLTIDLTGTVAAGDVFVVAHSSANAAILAEADQTNGGGWFNGDDAVVLVKGGVPVDSIGQVGVDPGTEWGTGLVSTADNTLRRMASVTAGDTVVDDVFDPALEWEGFATDTFDGLGSHGPDCVVTEELLLSEYIEGSSNNKALEFYNGTGVAIDLGAAGYNVQQFSNGGASAGLTINLTGTVAAGDVFVVAHSSATAAILAEADLTTGAGLFNGDDALVLRKGTDVVDSIGQVGFDPGTEWGTGLVSTADNTLRRMASVTAGDTVVDDVFDPALEWEGFAQDSFDGLGSHAGCGGDGDTDPVTPVINEFSVSTTGTDVEYLEVFGEPNTDYSDLSILAIEGDSPVFGTVDGVFGVGTTNADGLWLGPLAANAIENGTVSLLLVSGDTTGLTDVDANDDGVLDAGLPVEVIDAVAVHDGGAGDLTYSETVLGVAYDGFAFAPGGASRIPNGVDTDAAADWMRNDFDLYGITGFTGTPVVGEAINTPGAVNAAYEEEPPPVGGECGDPITLIGAVQGDGPATPMLGTIVSVEGVVVGDFDNEFEGFWVQDAGDGDDATSDGIFVSDPDGNPDVSVGDPVRVTGTVAEAFTVTQLSGATVLVCATDAQLPAPTELTLPATDEDKERVESMLVTLPQDLAILEYFNYGRFGEVVIGTSDRPDHRQHQPTAVLDPRSATADDLLEANLASRITLDDGRGNQNPTPAIHPNGEEFSLDNFFRGGDLVTNATGVLDYRHSLWRIQPTQGADFTAANPRPDVPVVGGDTTVASFNVLNYFTTLAGDGGRGADTPEEFERQEAKIVAALAEMDADVVGLIEIENNGDTAVGTLTAALNEYLGDDVYDFVSTGIVGTDEITTAFIYQPAEVSPVGDFALLDESVDSRFDTSRNRPALAQTFQPVEGGELVTVAVNHLKSKGSGCSEDGDTANAPGDPFGQGNCNATRLRAAQALADWMNGDPTETGSESSVIIGDLNSYDKEDPIAALTAAGFTDLLLERQGEYAYSYVFDGMLGYLDYALANAAASARVTGAEVWRINADEASLIDYDMSFKQPAEDALFAPDPFRSSDHDPVLVGLDLVADVPDDTTAPELEVEVDTPEIWPPNNKWRTIHTTVEASDDSGQVTVTLVGATASGANGADIEVVSDTEFKVRAVKNSVYTITYEATDAAGNTTTRSVEVVVPHDQGKGKGPK